MAQLAQATMWGAPLVQQPTHQVASRAVTVHYRLGEHFRVIEHNHGRKSERIPIYVATPGLIAFDHASPDRWPCTRADVPNVPGAFVLSNVLTPHECEQLLADSEAMGYCEDAPGSLGRDIRHNESCTWIANVTITSPIYQRVARLLPPEVAGGAVVGINRPFRLYKYNTDDVFRAHTDGSWPGTGVVNGLVATDVYGRAGSSGASVDPGSCDVVSEFVLSVNQMCELTLWRCDMRLVACSHSP